MDKNDDIEKNKKQLDEQEINSAFKVMGLLCPHEREYFTNICISRANEKDPCWYSTDNKSVVPEK